MACYVPDIPFLEVAYISFTSSSSEVASKMHFCLFFVSFTNIYAQFLLLDWSGVLDANAETGAAKEKLGASVLDLGCALQRFLVFCSKKLEADVKDRGLRLCRSHD
ncbi:hypothetical protein MKW98_025696 [Papaver atlanticum]|uniref:Uncharacterized protein n=1 Tax=Papaver atlanticum TaxID=357466 RepID=A0AAD4XC59_9MAGN|nr:hypothetical protein MKW98_025696 [Papaver atlanticum]